jgi:hypothetical protein
MASKSEAVILDIWDICIHDGNCDKPLPLVKDLDLEFRWYLADARVDELAGLHIPSPESHLYIGCGFEM